MRSGIGDTLRAARRARGHTLTDAAEATRVRESYLTALEEGDFDALGGDVYARGFLRSYARYLGLDPEPLLEAYSGGAPNPQRGVRGRPSSSDRPAADGGGQRWAASNERPPGTAVLLVLVLIVLLALAYIGLWGGRADAASAGVVAGLALGASR